MAAPLLHQYITVIRHGERRDALPSAEREVDPPLTENGKQQVATAAAAIKQAIGSTVARRSMILCSPFVRTIETAACLQSSDVGSERAATIDNTLCEVFGPLRIKSDAAPRLPLKVDAVGQLPRWGESIQDATDRFVHSFLRNAELHRNENLILVSHGDAISAILSHFYPKRVVYNAEFLSFIVMQRVIGGHSSGTPPPPRRSRNVAPSFVLHTSSGVDWMIDGDGEESLDDGGGASASISNSCNRDYSTSVSHLQHSPSPLTAERCVTSDYRAGSGWESSTNVGGWGDGPYGSIPRSGSTIAVGDRLSPRSPAVSANSGGGVGHPRMALLLHVFVVLSQVAVLRVWPSLRDAFVYVANVGVLELLNVKYGWKQGLDWMPFSKGSPRRRVLRRLLRYPLFRTVCKVSCVIVMYMLTAVPIGWMAGSTMHRVMASLGSMFDTAWGWLMTILFVGLDLWRGSMDPDDVVDEREEAS